MDVAAAVIVVMTHAVFKTAFVHAHQANIVIQIICVTHVLQIQIQRGEVKEFQAASAMMDTKEHPGVRAQWRRILLQDAPLDIGRLHSNAGKCIQIM